MGLGGLTYRPGEMLLLLCCLLGHLSVVQDDFELYGLPGGGDAYAPPLPLRELRHVVRLTRDALAHCEGVGVDTFAVPELLSQRCPFVLSCVRAGPGAGAPPGLHGRRVRDHGQATARDGGG